MTVSVAIPVLPDSAPFSPAQRAWLNGFFAGLFGARAAPDGALRQADATGGAPVAVAPAEAAADESFPWHDPALGMDERLKLAEGRPPSRVMVAAMAQLDCGAGRY